MEQASVACSTALVLIRRHWPTTRITIRGDGHYCRPEVMEWREAHGVDYVETVRMELHGLVFPLLGPGKATYIMGLIRGVTDLHLSAERIDRAEHDDQLTGSLNRYTFVERLDALSMRSAQLPAIFKINVAGPWP